MLNFPGSVLSPPPPMSLVNPSNKPTGLTMPPKIATVSPRTDFAAQQAARTLRSRSNIEEKNHTASERYRGRSHKTGNNNEVPSFHLIINGQELERRGFD
mmetsp:Transcript_26742/g.46098  ORF Transcript_26742/g.46098 Transcript_26742/m.46098 type:complete len:100 (+) Transcript_26742:275-574(+)